MTNLAVPILPIPDKVRKSRRSSARAAWAPLPMTDAGAAVGFARLHAGRARYAWAGSNSGVWHLYDGRRWAPDADGGVWRLARDVIGEVLREARRAATAQEQRALFDHARALQSRARLTSMLDLARSEPGIAVRADAFDADPWVLNLKNGTLDLRTGKLRPHRREDLLTKLAPVGYRPDALCPRWQAFLERILPDSEVQAFVQRALGGALVGGNSDQRLFLFIGTGANGKSTLQTVLRRTLGDYAMSTDATSFLDDAASVGPRPDLTRIVGARVLFVSEVPQGRRLDVALIKNLTGGDPLVARTLYCEPVEKIPQFSPFLSSNHEPTVPDQSVGAWRRILKIPFTVEIPLEEQDLHLVDALAEEGPGILAWLVTGCLACHREGLAAPPAVLAATEDYRLGQDVLADFIAERCALDPAAEILARDLYRAYCAWAEDAGERRPLSRRAFGMALRERGLTPKHRRTERWWHGIDLRGEAHVDTIFPADAPAEAEPEAEELL